jgi:hypothetical protein
MDQPLKVLVVGKAGWSLDEAARELEAAGHRTFRCQSDQGRSPCRRLDGDGACPLDVDIDVVLVVRSRPHPELFAAEAGATCGLQNRLPLVVSGRTFLNPFETSATRVLGPRDSVVEGCEEAARSGPARSRSDP